MRQRFYLPYACACTDDVVIYSVTIEIGIEVPQLMTEHFILRLCTRCVQFVHKDAAECKQIQTFSSNKRSHLIYTLLDNSTFHSILHTHMNMSCVQRYIYMDTRASICVYSDIYTYI